MLHRDVNSFFQSGTEPFPYSFKTKTIHWKNIHFFQWDVLNRYHAQKQGSCVIFPFPFSTQSGSLPMSEKSLIFKYTPIWKKERKKEKKRIG